jgi:hypothetical protein
LARGAKSLAYGPRADTGELEQSGQVISVAFDRRT